MFVQATDFYQKTPQLPGNAVIKWQGKGPDYGYAIIQGSLPVSGSTGWYMSDMIGWTEAIEVDYTDVDDVDEVVNLRYPDETDTLYPSFKYPETEWIGVKYRMTQEGDFIRNTTPLWKPREWQWWWMDEDDQFHKDKWFGDWWFQFVEGSFVPRGILKNTEDTISFTETRTNPDVWIWERGTGEGGAGVYRKLSDSTQIRTVGWPDDDNYNPASGEPANHYRLNQIENEETQGPVDMISLGVLRMPATEYVGTGLPTSWDFEGADWANPDPWDARYWTCIRSAMLERESAIPNHEMGTLVHVQGEDVEKYLFDFDPYGLPTFRAVQVYRQMLVELAKNYKDLNKVYKVIQEDGNPGYWYEDECIELPDEIGGGWCERDSVVSDTYGNLKAWLIKAKEALSKMGLLNTPAVLEKTPSAFDNFFYEYDADDFNAGHNVAWGNVYSTGLSEINKAQWTWTRRIWNLGRPASATSSIWVEGMHAKNSPEGTGDAYYAEGSGNDSIVESFNFPATSVLDGSTMSEPEIIDIYRSDLFSSDYNYEEGQKYDGGVLTHLSYYSEYFKRGIYVRRGLSAPITVEDEFPSNVAEPTQPTGIDPDTGNPYPYYEAGYTIMSNWTQHYFYAWWGDVFHFKADWWFDDHSEPDDEEEEEEEEEEPAPAPQPASLPSPELDWHIYYGPVEDTVELKGTGPYMIPARFDAYTEKSARSDGESVLKLNPNLQYHYPVLEGTRRTTLATENDRTVRAWWLYSRNEVPELVKGDDGWIYYRFKRRPSVASVRKNPKNFATSTIPMPTETYEEMLLRTNGF